MNIKTVIVLAGLVVATQSALCTSQKNTQQTTKEISVVPAIDHHVVANNYLPRYLLMN